MLNEKGGVVNSLSLKEAVLASSPPPNCYANTPPPRSSTAPFLEVCFEMKPVLLFFFLSLRQILHQNTDFIFEETGGFGIGPVSALIRMGMKFQKPSGKGPGDTQQPSLPENSCLLLHSSPPSQGALTVFSELTSWHFSPRSK